MEKTGSINTKHQHRSNTQYNHICTLEGHHGVIYQKWYIRVMQTFLISGRNPQTTLYFRSRAAIEKERKRQVDLKYFFIIHPFSLFRMYWEATYVFIIIVSMMVAPMVTVFVRFTFNFKLESLEETVFEKLDLALDMLMLCDVLISFRTGYCIANKREVVLTPKLIMNMYVRRVVLYRDLIINLPLGSLILAIACTIESMQIVEVVAACQLISLCKMLRIFRLMNYLNNTTSLCRSYHYLNTCVKHAICVVMIFHWMNCIYILVTQFKNANSESLKYELFTGLIEYDIFTVYTKGLFVTSSYLLGISLVNVFRFSIYYYFTDDYSFGIFVVFSITGFLLCNLALVLVLQMIMTMNSPQIKYYSIISQLKMYMSQKNLSKNMRARILSYYEYRFQKKYFRECTILAMLSDSLKRDINLYSCRTLIENVSLLKDLPPDVINDVVCNLKQEVYLYNDVIVKAGSAGDCMYFISKGTVAVSTPTGKEICHLQDGAYFGEIALIAKDQRRVANVVAIEICEIYRLDRRNFKNCFAQNSVHFKKIEQIAQERMEKTTLLEELHKKYILENTKKRKVSTYTTKTE